MITLGSSAVLAQDMDNKAVEDALKTVKKTDTTSQKQGWYTGGFGNLNFGQTTLSNWAAGGESTITALGLVELFAHFRQAKLIWNNNLKLNYGLIKTADNPVEKNDDQFDLTTKAGLPAFKDWYYSLYINFLSQLSPTFEADEASGASRMVSGFLNPGYLIGALGMDFLPSGHFSVFLSPLTAKYTFVLDTLLADAGMYGVEGAVFQEGSKISSGKKIRSELGAFISLDYQRDILENVNFSTSLDLFESYTSPEIAIDVNWETLIAMKINKYLTASIFGHLIYDQDIDITIDENKDGITDRLAPRTQFKEVLGIGLSHKF